jgi:hypothetical protein
VIIQPSAIRSSPTGFCEATLELQESGSEPVAYDAPPLSVYRAWPSETARVRFVVRTVRRGFSADEAWPQIENDYLIIQAKKLPVKHRALGNEPHPVRKISDVLRPASIACQSLRCRKSLMPIYPSTQEMLYHEIVRAMKLRSYLINTTHGAHCIGTGPCVR